MDIEYSRWVRPLSTLTRLCLAFFLIAIGPDNASTSLLDFSRCSVHDNGLSLASEIVSWKRWVHRSSDHLGTPFSGLCLVTVHRSIFGFINWSSGLSNFGSRRANSCQSAFRQGSIEAQSFGKGRVLPGEVVVFGRRRDVVVLFGGWLGGRSVASFSLERSIVVVD